MARRIYIPDLQLGEIPLTPGARHYLVDVLRLPHLTEVEPFNTMGDRGRATLFLSGSIASLQVHEIFPPAPYPALTIASAVPKGDRADYLVEKLAELGVLRWVPLATERSVVLPKGESKRTRWERIAQEAARQAHAPGVLQIADLVTLPKFIDAAIATNAADPAAGITPVAPMAAVADATPAARVTWFCSTGPGSLPAPDAPTPTTVVIGPEGGFTEAEEATMRAANWHGVSLGRTVLRVETAAVLAAYAALQLSR